MPKTPHQLISYIAPGAPATRRLADGTEPFLRPEVGFTPRWYRDRLGIDFGKPWHEDPGYRRESILAMREELRKRFPGSSIGGIDRPDDPLDLLTGLFGANVVSSIYGIPIIYSPDNWPNCEHQYLDPDEIDRLTPPDLDTNPFFQRLLEQVDRIADREGQVTGFINWQGILNNAQRLRGQELFLDMMEFPDRCLHLFDCLCLTMIQATKRLRERQKESGVDYRFFTVSNCLVNMVSPIQYRSLLLPFDIRLSEAFDCIGIHNCAWNANPYLDDYSAVPNVAYIDMGIDSDLERARRLFPDARRALMYTPMDLANKPLEEIQVDFDKIAEEYGPCDIVLADIETDTPDERVLQVLEMCKQYGEPEA